MSTEWSAGFPAASLAVPDPSILPAAWVNAYNAAVAAGKIPKLVVSQQTAPNTNPFYPGGLNPSSPEVCSATYQCRIPGDIWDSPDGIFASSFDDGPTPVSCFNYSFASHSMSINQSTTGLVQFLNTNNVTTTHFMIGYNIIYYPSQFSLAFESNHDIAVHTWTHPYMTTLTDLQVVGEVSFVSLALRES